MSPNGAKGNCRVSLHGGHTVAGDGASTATAMVRAAEAAGLSVFGVSEHFYRPREDRFRYDHEEDHHDFGRAGWPALVEEVEALKASRSGAASMRFCFGAEVEYLPGFADWTRAELRRWPLDFTVLSVHFLEVDGEVIPLDLSPDHWHHAKDRAGGEVALYCLYYDHVLNALTWDLGDILGHLDVIKIFADHPVEDPAIDERVDRILQLCRRRGMALDLNARGLLKPCREVYPGPELLRRAHEAGVVAITGDDSHQPDQVGMNLDAAVGAAQAAGYRQLCLPPRLGGECWDL